MSDLGLGLIQRFIELTKQDTLMECIPPRLKPAVTLILGFIPLALCTLILPAKIVPVLAILNVPYFYIFSHKMQQDLFNMAKKDVYLWLMTPLEIALVIWAGLLILLGKIPVFVQTLGFFAALIIVAILPGVRWNEAKKERQINYLYTYSVVGVLFIIQQLFVLVRSFQ